jgi:hypothetical protein
MSEPATRKIVFGPCCFCGADIAPEWADPCTVTVETAGGKWQVWKAHGACFKARLAELPEAPGLFDPAHF